MPVVHAILVPVAWLIGQILFLYLVVVFAAVAASWLIAFGVLNSRNEAVRQILRILDALTEPVFRRIRRIVPPVGGLDLSPIFVLLGVTFLRILFAQLFALFEPPIYFP